MNELFPLDSTWSWLSILQEPIFLSHLALPFLWLAMGYVLLVQYQFQAKSVANAKTHLELTLQEREAELVKSYDHLKRLELVEATRAERDRIYQDVHDGIGSRLVNAMFNLRKGNANPQLIESSLKDCLSDLRLVINAQIDEASDIQSSVFAQCLEQEAHLNGSDLEFSYDVFEGSPLHLPPQMHLNILRILQESMTNAIKHSLATTMHVKLEKFEQLLLLSVIDNGKGFTAAVESSHASWFGGSGKRGLVGMDARAKSIGAEYSLTRVDVHTIASLRLPLGNPSDCH